MDNITAIFKEKKLKLTPQRLAVYQYLMNTTTHPSAETIYKALQPVYPTMSLATIYKALKTLVEVGLIQEINVGEGNFRYDGNADQHAHIQCVKCCKVDDLGDVDVSSITQNVESHTTYHIQYSKIFFYGICEACQ